MKKTSLFINITATVSLLAGTAIAAETWSYQGKEAFQHWGELDKQYAACKTGLKQSPINIYKYEIAELPALEVGYRTTKAVVVNNGHTVQVNAPKGGMIQVGNTAFNLLQYHFHTPSEHYIDGAPYPMEVHFVHKAADGTLGVLGVMMEVGAMNPSIEKIWQATPQSVGEGDAVEISAVSLLPSKLDYFKYEGSLTTPPCSEGVQWHVAKQPIQISEKQLIAFQQLFPINARPIQPINTRKVLGK